MSNNDKKLCVYVHTNKINGKKYVGITSQNPQHRWGKDGAGYKQQTHFWNAIQKYGWDNFRHEVLLINETKEFACLAEKALIKAYKSNNPKYGYNLTIGGENLMGKDAYWYGKTLSEEHKQKVKENHADFNGGNHPRAKQVYCIELNQVFECMRDVQRKLKINAREIGDCCKGKRNTAGDYHWIYAEDIGKCDILSILSKKKHARITGTQKVRCINTGETFNSITIASRITNCPQSSISACCRGVMESTNGLNWEYVYE